MKLQQKNKRCSSQFTERANKNMQKIKIDDYMNVDLKDFKLK